MPFKIHQHTSGPASNREHNQELCTIELPGHFSMEGWSNLSVWLWVVLSVCDDVLRIMPASLPMPPRALEAPVLVSESEKAAHGARYLERSSPRRFPLECTLNKAAKSFQEQCHAPQIRELDEHYQTAQMVWNQSFRRKVGLEVQENFEGADARWTPAVTGMAREGGCGGDSRSSVSADIWGTGFFQAWS